MVSLATEAALAAWRRALPEREWAAVEPWLGHFYGFQAQWILSEARFAALIKSRQIGASHTFAGWAVLRALLGECTTVVSVGEREALEVIAKAQKHASALVALGSAWAIAKSKSGELTFQTGGRILALPASSGGRGYSGNVIVDEFAFAPNAAQIWDAASGAVMHGYKMRVMSTPCGASGEFYKLVTDSKQNAGWAIWRTTVDDAIREGMHVDLAECWSMARNDRRVFDQLFRCSFLNSDEQYLSNEIVEAAIQADGDVGATHHELVGRLRHYVGIDVGLINDCTAIVVVAQDVQTNKCWVVDVVAITRRDWGQIQTTIEGVIEQFNPRCIAVDSTGLGLVPTQLLQKRFGRRVVGVNFSRPIKAELATGLFQALADGMLKLQNRRDLVSDLYMLKRIVSSNGSVTFDADHDENGHADRAWALALAIYGIGRRSGQIVATGGTGNLAVPGSK